MSDEETEAMMLERLRALFPGRKIELSPGVEMPGWPGLDPLTLPPGVRATSNLDKEPTE